MHDFRWPALVTLGAVVLMFVMAANVGRARGRYGIPAPATSGNPAMMFLPALWVFAAFISEVCAAGIGVTWLVARVWYAMSYQKAAALRGPAFVLSMLCVTVLTLGGAWGIIRSVL
jgi:glutathione S-transferase